MLFRICWERVRPYIGVSVICQMPLGPQGSCFLASRLSAQRVEEVSRLKCQEAKALCRPRVQFAVNPSREYITGAHVVSVT